MIKLTHGYTDEEVRASKVCDRCGSDVYFCDKFCHHCGTKLSFPLSKQTVYIHAIKTLGAVVDEDRAILAETCGVQADEVLGDWRRNDRCDLSYRLRFNRMRCANCGREVSYDGFCTECGAKVKAKEGCVEFYVDHNVAERAFFEALYKKFPELRPEPDPCGEGIGEGGFDDYGSFSNNIFIRKD